MNMDGKRPEMNLHSVLSIIMAFVLFGLGFALLIGTFSIGTIDWWLSGLILLVGLFMFSTPGASNYSVGLLLSGVGLFTLLRTMEIIETPWLKYLLGGFLMLTAVINIFRNVFGNATPINQTWGRRKSDKA